MGRRVRAIRLIEPPPTARRACGPEFSFRCGVPYKLPSGRADGSWGEPQPNGMALMDDTTSDSSSEEAHASNICQECGAPDAQHRSYLFVVEQERGELVLLCDECHRARLGL